MVKRYLTILVFLTGFFSLSAQEKSVNLDTLLNMTLEELLNAKVTTVSKTPQKISEAPATVYIITQKQIEDRNYSCLKDLLEDIPQIEIQSKSDAQITDVYTVNGIVGSEKFIIMKDGIRINSMTGTYHTLGESYTLGNTKQVEVILGPASSLYGADAFTGIINIITNKGSENKGLIINSSYGIFNTSNNELVYNAGKKDFSISILGKYYHSDEPYFPDYYPKDYEWYNVYKSRGDVLLNGDTINTGSIKPWATPTNAYTLQFKLNYKNLEFGYSRLFESHSDAIANPPSATIYSKETVYADHLQNAYVKHRYNSTDDKLQLYSTLSAQEFKVYPYSLYINQYSGFTDAYKYERDRVLKLEEQINYTFSSKSQFVGGATYEYIQAIPKTSDLPVQYNENLPFDEQNIYYPGSNVIDSSGKDLTIIQEIYNIKYYNIGTYIQYHYHFKENLFMTLGTRYDYNSRYNSTVNPRIGLVYNTNKYFVKVLYGHAYLAPSPYHAYQQFGSFYPVTNQTGEITGLASGFWQLANPDLQPEKVISYAVSTLYQISNKLAVSANLYYNDIQNLIEVEGTTEHEFKGVTVGLINKPINEGYASSYGGTLMLSYKGLLGNSVYADGFAAYSYSDGKIEDKPLIASSKNTIKTGLGIQYKKFGFYTQLTYRSGSYTRNSTLDNLKSNDPYTVVKLSSKYRIAETEKFNTSIFLNIRNLFNIRYYNIGYHVFDLTPQDPIRVEFGINLEIK